MITSVEFKNLRNEVKNGLRRAEFARKMLEEMNDEIARMKKAVIMTQEKVIELMKDIHSLKQQSDKDEETKDANG